MAQTVDLIPQPSGILSWELHAVSPSGEYLAGNAFPESGGFFKFVWSENTGIELLPFMFGPVLAVSDDGDRVLMLDDDTDREFLWIDSSGSWEELVAPEDGRNPRARAMSGAGDLIVGDIEYERCDDPNRFDNRGAKWVGPGSGMPLTGVTGCPCVWSYCFDVSADGRVLVGGVFFGEDRPCLTKPARWSGGGSSASLLPVPGGYEEAWAWAVSLSGRWVAGATVDTDQEVRLLLWGPNNELLDLGPRFATGYTRLDPKDVRNDGQAVLLSNAGLYSAAIWTSQSGVIRLIDWLQAYRCFDMADFDRNSFQAVGLDQSGAIWGRGILSGRSVIWRVGDGENDNDGDGLPNCWETVGIPYDDANGDLRFYELDFDGDGEPDADPEHKDIFVEVDELAGYPLFPPTVTMLEAAFANAPVSNPDGLTGIRLHILVSDIADVLPATWQTDSTGWPTAWEVTRRDWFGSALERSERDAGSKVLEARSKAVRYCVLAETLDDAVLGIAENIPADDFIVAMGDPVHTDGLHDEEDTAATWMHELGHTLGLGHGGGDDILGKPNYPSIMNYMYADIMDFNEDFWALDFCRVGSLPTLDETSLDETAGIDSGGMYDGWIAPFGVTDSMGDRVIRYVQLDGRPTDFGTPGDPDGRQDNSFSSSVVQDLNYIGPDLPVSGADLPTPGETLHPFDDWANLIYAVGDGSDSSQPRRGGELTSDAVDWINDNFPPPDDCEADFDGDGQADTRDVLAFLNAWAAGDPSADFNGDGIVDTRDVLAFLNVWTAGC